MDPVRFVVVGLDHPHAYSMTLALLGGGAVLAGFHATDDAAASGFAEFFDRPRRFPTPEAALADSASLVVLAGVPSDRAGVAIAALHAGKHVLSDKPAVTTADQLDALRAAQRESRRRLAIWFSERFESRATERASTLVADGAIGDVVHVTGFGPHRLSLTTRPPWFLDPGRNGGILNDLASHQIDQFLHFTGDHPAEVVSSMVANRAHPEYPTLEDYGEVILRSATASGFARVDWFTPDGLPSWGDVRVFLVGTAGSVEIRKNIDPAGREGGEHLLLVDHRGVHHFDCAADPLPFVAALLDDLRSERADPGAQDHAFVVCDLALRAQHQAARMGNLT